MFFVFIASITKLEGGGMVVVAAVVTGLEVVAAVMEAEVVATGMVVLAVGMVAEVVTGLEVVAVLDVVTKMVVAGVEDAISSAISPLNSIRSLCPFKMIFLLVLFMFFGSLLVFYKIYIGEYYYLAILLVLQLAMYPPSQLQIQSLLDFTGIFANLVSSLLHYLIHHFYKAWCSHL